MDRERDTSVTFKAKVDRGVVLLSSSSSQTRLENQSRGDRIVIGDEFAVVVFLCDCLVFQA